MINLRSAVVKKIVRAEDRLAELDIDIDGRPGQAVNYQDLTGPVAAGDRVIVNTTAVDLRLGSGGKSFVVWNLARGDLESSGEGHLMKLRYTPFQHAALSVEEEDSPHHDALQDIDDIDGLPVIACGLHSQLLPIAVTAKALKPDVKIAYVMTGGGALPMVFSRVTGWLRKEGYLAATITAGQAFGGDFEAVNIYSALAAAKVVAGADIAVVAMGPGIAGTGSKLGHTGIEQGQIINAASALNGRAVAVLRISGQDKRFRHQGISHHSLTALSLVSLGPAVIPIPELPGDSAAMAGQIDEQLDRAGLGQRHEIRRIDNSVTLDELATIAGRGGPRASTMGRGPSEEPVFFLAAGAAAYAAVDLL